MSVRAKLTCNSVHEGKTWDNKPSWTILMQAAYDGSEENKTFFASTPGASLVLYTVSEDAAKQFTEGKSYYLDFTEAP